ncbi:MAG: sugar-binding protein [Oscillospiraceae bacterium]|jgi:putative multiple sugar transport system substrate-binding protein|nr:sugar-binding protein [Oscillospiraceae bacterium]
MKKKLSFFLSLFIALGLSVALTGCNNKSGGAQVGIVLPTREEPRWLQDEAKFRELIEATDYKVEFRFSDGSSAKEKQNVDELVGLGIKVLIICPQKAEEAAASVAAAKDKGVKVISYDRLILGSDAIDYYVTFDSVAVGKAQGQYLIDNASGTNNPLYLYAGGDDDNNAFLFFEGAWSVLQPKIADGTFVIKNSKEAAALRDKQLTTDENRDELEKIIKEITTGWDFNKAKSLAESDMLKASAEDKKEVFVLAPNDGTARAIADVFAVNANGYVITGQDAEKESVQYVIDGKQSMTVFKDTRVLASDVMDMAVAIIEGKTVNAPASYNNGVKDVPSKQTAVVAVDKNNVKKELIDTGYYKESDFAW